MLSYSTYSEAGGVGKTTTAANLAVAHARAGLDVLVVPLDQQEGDLSRLFGVDENRAADVNTLAHHMIRRPKGEFEDLIVEAEHGVDIIPEHNNLGDLGDWLDREKEQAEAVGEAFGVNSALLRVLKDAGVPEEYDVLICDPPATEGVHLHNAINATRSLVIPVEATAKGEAAVDGLEELVGGLEETLSVDIGVLAAVPTRFEGTNDQKEVVDEIEYPVPEIIRKRASLMEGCWKKQCSAFNYVRDHRDRRRDHEMDTLAKFDRLARFLEDRVGIAAPNPPEPGAIRDKEGVEA
jgi:cellulose biosynthesis protein BcsQ